MSDDLLNVCKESLLSGLTTEKCPNCGAEDFDACHAQASYSLPETYYKTCNVCNRQWGHE